MAEANAITDSGASLSAGTILQKPSVASVKNDASSFKPYNPNEIVGSTTPSLPYVPPTPCNPMMIIVIIVMIIVTIYTAGAAAGAMGATGTAAGGTATVAGTAGATTATSIAGTSTLAGATTTTALTAAGTVSTAGAFSMGSTLLSGGMLTGSIGASGIAASAFIGGVAGSIAGQVVGNALGVSQGFSLRQAIAGGITSVLTAGIGAGLGGSTSGLMKNASSVGGWGKVAASALGNAAAGYVGNRIAGVNDTSFSWKAIAAGAVTNVATAAIGNGLNKLGLENSPIWGEGQFAGNFARNAIGGVVSLHVRRAFGFDDRVDYGSIAADAFGNALASEMVQRASAPRSNVQTARNKAAINADQQAAADRILSMSTTSLNGVGGLIDPMDYARLNYGADYDSALDKLGGGPTVLYDNLLTGFLSAGEQGTRFESKSYNAWFTPGEVKAVAAYIKASGIGNASYTEVVPESMVLLLPQGASPKEVYGEITKQLGNLVTKSDLLETVSPEMFRRIDADRVGLDRSDAINLTPLKDEVLVRFATKLFSDPRVIKAGEQYESATYKIWDGPDDLPRMRRTEKQVYGQNYEYVIGGVTSQMISGGDLPKRIATGETLKGIYRTIGWTMVGFGADLAIGAGVATGGALFRNSVSLSRRVMFNLRANNAIVSIQTKTATTLDIHAVVSSEAQVTTSIINGKKVLRTINADGVEITADSMRELVLGNTPNKTSRAGNAVFDRMSAAGEIKDIGGTPYFRSRTDNRWYPVYSDKTHMAHDIQPILLDGQQVVAPDAVTWWNQIGRPTGARSPEVRSMMLDSDNYYFELGRYNSSQGARLNQTYLPPLMKPPGT